MASTTTTFTGVDYYQFDSLLSEEELAVRDAVREWVDAALMPVIGEAYIEGKFPKQIIPGMAELGLFGANLPEEYGCAGLNNVAYGLIMQELERGDSGIRSFASVQGALVMYPIYSFGSDEQKNYWLPRLASGEDIGCFGLTEPDYGSNPGGLITTAKETADGWVLNGVKMWITNGSQATVSIIWAKTGDIDDAKSIRGFIVPTNTPGYSARDQKGKLSLRASDTSEIHLQDVHLPKDAVLPKSGGVKSPLMCSNPGPLRDRLGRDRRGDGVLRRSPPLLAGAGDVRSADRADPDPASPPGRHVDRDHQGPVPDAAARSAQGRRDDDAAAGLARQAQQCQHGD